MSRKLWNRRELIIAMNLYCKLPFGHFDKSNSTIISVAEKLGRTPSSLAMKLANIASIDPFHQNRGIKGLKGYSRQDKAIWDEFNNNWETMILQSEQELETLLNTKEEEKYEEEYQKNLFENNEILIIKNTEKETIIKVRKGQNFFRNTVLSSYNNCCCITGNNIPELLVASHILPWAKYREHRLNPRNGLCLARTHDSAFDRGLISFDHDYKLIISPYLESFLPNETLQVNFIAYKNKQMMLPSKFKPDANFLLFHRENIFRH